MVDELEELEEVEVEEALRDLRKEGSLGRMLWRMPTEDWVTGSRGYEIIEPVMLLFVVVLVVLLVVLMLMFVEVLEVGDSVVFMSRVFEGSLVA